MPPSTWSNLTFFIHIENTANVVFIRCRDLPQPSTTEVVPSTLGIEDLFAKITECCHLAELTGTTHLLYDFFDRPIENGELLRESLAWLVEDIGCSTRWMVKLRDNCQRAFADSSTQTSDPYPLRSSSGIFTTTTPLRAPVSTISTPSSAPTSCSPTAIGRASTPTPEQGLVLGELSASNLASPSSTSGTVPPSVEQTETAPLPHTTEQVVDQDTKKIVSPAQSLPLRVSLPTASPEVTEVNGPNLDQTSSPIKEDTKDHHTIKKARIAEDGSTAAAIPTKTSDEDDAQTSAASPNYCANDYRHRKRPPTFDAEGAARYNKSLAEVSGRQGDGANADQPIVVDSGSQHSVHAIADEQSSENEGDSEEAQQQDMMEHTGYDAFDEAWVENKFDQWNPAMWPDVCKLFRQPSQEQDERWFTHVHWLERKPYSYQCYGAYFMIMAERSLGGVLLADEMGLGKTMTVMVALATISMTMKAYPKHSRCTPDACTVSSPKFGPCWQSPQSPSFSQWTFLNLPTLIIVPTGTINVWEAEFKKSVRSVFIEVRKSHGDQFARFDDLLVKDDGTPWQKDNHDRPLYKVVVLTTKESLRTRVMPQLKKVNGRGRVIAHLKFARVIVDESHEICNPNALFNKNLEILCRGKQTAMWFMTGTPLPKGPGSVKANIICWSRCRGDSTLLAKHETVIGKYNSTARQLDKASDTGNETADRSMARLAKLLADMLKPYMLQRTAETRFRGQVLLGVPKMKSEQVKLDFISPWEAKWHTYYNELQGKLEAERIRRRDEAVKTGIKPRPVLILNYLRMARIYAGVPGLMDYEGAWTVDDITEKVGEDGDLFNTTQIKALYSSSAKLQALVKECRQLGIPTTEEPERQGKSGEKMVVFASTPIEAHIIDLTLRKIAQVASTMVQQSQRPPVRLSVINNDFQDNIGAAQFDVLVGTFALIGRGYTMVRARTAILFGPEWLESTEKQAQYRIKRIGQQHETRSIRYQMKASIEALIVRRQQYRSTFDDRVLGQEVPDKKPLSLSEILKAVEEVDVA